MRVTDAIARALKDEGVEYLICYPRQALIDSCAAIGIRPIVCRQERVGMGIADGVSRSTYGKRIGVFSMQGGPGAENTFPGVAQVFGDNVPVLIMPGHRIGRSFTHPSFDPVQSFKPVTKWGAEIAEPGRALELVRRAFHNLRSGKLGPVVLEVPTQVGAMEMPGEYDYKPVRTITSGPDPDDVKRVATLLLESKSPVIHAGQGVLYSGATRELVQLAELLNAPVLTTNTGKGAFPEDHPLSLGAMVISAQKSAFHFLKQADVVLGMGTSLTRNPWAPQIPSGKRIIHCTLDASDVGKEFPTEAAILGDARLVLLALIVEIGERRRPGADVAGEIARLRAEWEAEWASELTSAERPINQYRIINDLRTMLDPANVIITHDAGSPREQLIPFWRTVRPGGYLGWGKSTQLGHGLGLIMGAKLANPDKICINLMGDASIGMVGMDIETAVRNRLGILTIVFNNGVMAGEKNGLVEAQAYNAADLGGDYSQVAKGLGAWSVRLENPDDFKPALATALKANAEGKPALIEIVAKQNFKYSRY